VWLPSDRLEEFFAKINPGDRIFLKAQEEEGSEDLFSSLRAVKMKFHVIREVIKLSDGSRYKFM